MKEYVKQINSDLVADCIPKNSYQEQWQIDLLEKEIFRVYGVKLDIKSVAQKEGSSESEVLEFITQKIDNIFKNKEQEDSPEAMRQVEQQIFLITIDSEWKDHLLSLDKLRSSINLRAYGQKDPLIEYKREAFELFEDMMMRVEEQLVNRISHVQINFENRDEEEINIIKERKQKTFETRSDPALAGVKKAQEGANQSSSRTVKTKVNPQDRDPNDPSSWGNVGRNEPCPCGSGKKYKQCYGA